MNLKSKIKNVLLSESTKNIWRNNHSSKEWQLANEVSKVILREPLIKSHNCGCVDELFQMLKLTSQEKIDTILKKMENKFRLRKDVLIMSHQLGDPISNNNLTDEMAIRILKLSKKNVDKFEVLPDNWEQLVDWKASKKETSKETSKGSNEVTDWRVKADELAEAKGLKKPHWNLSDEKLEQFVKENS